MNISPVNYTPDFGSPGPAPAAPQKSALKITPVDTTPDFGGVPKDKMQMPDVTSNIQKGVDYFKSHDMTMQLINAARDGKLQKWLESPWHLKEDVKNLPKNVRKGVTSLVKEAVQNPGSFIASTLKGMMESPEMFLVGGVEGELVKRAVVGGAVNAGLGAAGSVGQQLQQTGTVDPQQVTQSAVGGALMGGALGAVGGHEAPEVKPPVPEAAPVPRLTYEARSNPAQLHEVLDAHVNAREQAALQEQNGPAPKTHLVEGHVLGEGTVVPYDHPALVVPGKKTALESAVDKVKAGQKFNMTAEEKIQWDRLSKGEQQLQLERAMKPRGDTRDVPRFPEPPSEGSQAQGHVLGDQPAEGTNMPGEEKIAGNQTQPRTRFGAKQGGGLDPDLLKKLGIAAGGAIAFNYLDPQDGWKSAATGAALALTGAWMAPRLSEGLKADARLRIDNYTNNFEATSQIAKVRLHGFVQGIQKAIPDAERRVAITHWLDGEKISLPPEDLKVAKSIRAFFDKSAYDLKKHNMMEAAREDYVTHLWDIPQNKGRMGGAITTKSPFTKARTYSTLAEGKAAGLVPKTEDIAAIVHTYGTSVDRAMAGKTFVDTLKGLQGPDGRPLIAPADKAPRGYVPVDLPQLRGSLVHPDIAPSIRMFESPRLSQPFEAVSEGMQAVKRVKVMGSLFHIKTLAEVALTGGSLKRALGMPGQLATFAAGKDAMLEALNNGGMSEDVQALIRGGTTFSLEGDTPGVEDIGGSFYQGMQGMQQYLDAHSHTLAKMNKTFTAVNHKLDTLTWARVQTGFKFLLGSDKMHQLMANGVEKEKAAEIASSYVNTLFGGLNWRRIAEGAHTRWGRDIALAMLHPKARTVSQILLFAPDWTLSTIRQITQAIRRKGSLGEQVKGFFKPTELADLHRQALVRSAVYYLMVGSAVNEYFTGKPIWENRNPLRIDLGDGRTMQFSKHLTEPLEWLRHPGETAARKLSYAVTEPLNQITGKEYIGGPPMQENPLIHAAKGILPFPSTANSPGAALSGMAGFPIYGHTREQTREIARARYEREHTPAAIRKREEKRMKELESR